MAWDIVSGVVLLAWAIIHPILKLYATVITWLFKTITMPLAKLAFKVVSDVVLLAWKIIHPILSTFGDVFKTIFTCMRDLAKTVWDHIASFIRGSVSIAKTVVRTF